MQRTLPTVVTSLIIASVVFLLPASGYSESICGIGPTFPNEPGAVVVTQAVPLNATWDEIAIRWGCDFPRVDAGLHNCSLPVCELFSSVTDPSNPCSISLWEGFGLRAHAYPINALTAHLGFQVGGFYVPAGVWFQLYQGVGDAIPYGEPREGPAYVAATGDYPLPVIPFLEPGTITISTSRYTFGEEFSIKFARCLTALQAECGTPNTAYVIIGNLQTPEVLVLSSLDPLVYAAEQAAADLAAQRFTDAGYTVERRGIAAPGQWATKAEFELAMKDPNITALWISAHGTDDDLAHPDDWYMSFRDGTFDVGIIKSFRDISQSALNELTLHSCNSGTYFDPQYWGLKENASVTTISGWTWAPKTLGSEISRSCSDSNAPHGLTGVLDASGSGLPAQAGWMGIVPMHMVDEFGTLGDDLYGTIAGSWQAIVTDSFGEAEFVDNAAGISGTISGLTPGQPVDVLMNRYTSAPAHPVPPSVTTLAGFAVSADCDAQGTQLAFTYDTKIHPDAGLVQVWRFDEATREFVELNASVDTGAQRVTTSTDHWGRFLLGYSTVHVELSQFRIE